MKTEDCLSYLQHPGSDEPADFFIEGNFLIDRHTQKKYPVINNMIDFTGINAENDDDIHNKKKLLFKINNIFSKYVDAKILMSVFAGGGIGFKKAVKQIKTWFDQVSKEKTLFLEPEDKNLLNYIGHENCITIEDLACKNVLPAKEFYPDVNASMEQIPVKSDSFQNIISYFVIEHVKNPQNHIKELARILKPGGYLILGGPGDVYPSHRVPYNYFNIIRFGYYEMIKENNLELVEEYYPSKSWLSILYLCYTTVVRNSLYNKNQYTKLLQLVIFLISLILSPVLNGIALLMDRMTPFDKRVYSLYLALLKKND